MHKLKSNSPFLQVALNNHTEMIHSLINDLNGDINRDGLEIKMENKRTVPPTTASSSSLAQYKYLSKFSNVSVFKVFDC